MAGSPIQFDLAVRPETGETLSFLSKRGERGIEHLKHGRINSRLSLQGGIFRLRQDSPDAVADLVKSTSPHGRFPCGAGVPGDDAARELGFGRSRVLISLLPRGGVLPRRCHEDRHNSGEPFEELIERDGRPGEVRSLVAEQLQESVPVEVEQITQEFVRRLRFDSSW